MRWLLDHHKLEHHKIAWIAALALGLHFATGTSSMSAENTPAAPSTALLMFDTDRGNDIDDALALGVIHALAGRRECRLLAVTVSKDNPLAAEFCDLVNVFYGDTGRTRIPVGRVRDGKTPEPGKFLPGVVNAVDSGRPRSPQRITGGDDTPDAAQLLRRVLAEQPDNSVTLVVVGFSTNIARLLETKPDDVSPLDGMALVEQKVALLSMMAGRFGSGGTPTSRNTTFTSTCRPRRRSSKNGRPPSSSAATRSAWRSPTPQSASSGTTTTSPIIPSRKATNCT